MVASFANVKNFPTVKQFTVGLFLPSVGEKNRAQRLFSIMPTALYCCQ